MAVRVGAGGAGAASPAAPARATAAAAPPRTARAALAADGRPQKGEGVITLAVACDQRDLDVAAGAAGSATAAVSTR